MQSCFLRLPRLYDSPRVGVADLAGGCSGSDDLTVADTVAHRHRWLLLQSSCIRSFL